MKLYTETELVLLQSNYDTNEEARNLDGNTVDFQPVVKWFDIMSGATWLISEVDHNEELAFGLCDLGFGFPELGLVAISEIKSLKLGSIPRIERDIHFAATQSLTRYANEARQAGCISC